jgi:hypothetical protein
VEALKFASTVAIDAPHVAIVAEEKSMKQAISRLKANRVPYFPLNLLDFRVDFAYRYTAIKGG